ncbi:MAG: MFS transporter [Thermobifida fusca]|nr:MFS transporter [Thermobifida fusca]
MTWGVYAYAFFQDLIPLYPVYALLFADTGATDGQISALFALWTLVAFTFEVPSGLLADRWARRPLVAAAPLLAGAAFALWTLFPSFPVFAAGFVLWGAGGALGSGAFQALVYDTLAAAGRTSDYPRLIGRSRALATGAVLASGLLTGPLLLIGGYAAVGQRVSPRVCSPRLLQGSSLRLPATGPSPANSGSGEPGVVRGRACATPPPW